MDGTLTGAQRSTLAAHLADCDACAAALGEVDEAERDLVLGLLWADAGGVDSALPVFPAERAEAAAIEGLSRRTGRNVVSFRGRRRAAAWGAVAAAAAATLLLWGRPTPEIPSDHQARGAVTPVLGEAMDLSLWRGGVPGRPVLSGDAIEGGAALGLSWTNPPREGGAWRHLSVVARTDGGWRVLDQRAIGVVAFDHDRPPAGPVPLDVAPGEVEVCGVFSHDRPSPDALRGGAAVGPRVCTRLTVQ